MNPLVVRAATLDNRRAYDAGAWREIDAAVAFLGGPMGAPNAVHWTRDAGG